MEDYRLYGKPAQVATFTVDYLAESLDPPTIVAVVDFERRRTFDLLPGRL